MERPANQFETQEEKVSPIALERATEGDLDFVYRLHKVTTRDRVEAIRGWDSEDEHADMAHHFTPGFDNIITVNGERAGIFRTVPLEDNSILIDRFEILPEFQGVGVGRTILSEFLKEHADELIRAEIPKKSSVQERSAVELFRRLGFEVYSESDQLYQLIKSPKRYIP